jgi:hypothetical protein
MIELVSPLGRTRKVAQQSPVKRLESPAGLRLGFVWNQYQTTKGFWSRLESSVEAACRPSSIERAYKSNTWMPLEKDRFRALSEEVDYLVVGVGA